MAGVVVFLGPAQAVQREQAHLLTCNHSIRQCVENACRPFLGSDNSRNNLAAESVYHRTQWTVFNQDELTRARLRILRLSRESGRFALAIPPPRAYICPITGRAPRRQ